MSKLEDELNKIGKIITDEAKAALAAELPKRSSSGRSYSSRTNASGKTSESIKYSVTGSTIVFSADESLFFASNGRRPGKMPPIDRIKEWVLDKGFLGKVSESKLTGVAFAIAKNISKRGTNPEYANVIELIEKRADELITKALEDNIDIILNLNII